MTTTLPTPETVRAAAEAGDVRTLLDLWSALCPEECAFHTWGTISYYTLADPEASTFEPDHPTGVSFAFLRYAVQAACLRRGWISRVDVEPLYSEAFVWDDPDDNAIGQQIVDASDALPATHAPAVALLAAYLCGVLATRNDA